MAFPQLVHNQSAKELKGLRSALATMIRVVGWAIDKKIQWSSIKLNRQVKHTSTNLAVFISKATSVY